jgi:hypothetical protein
MFIYRCFTLIALQECHITGYFLLGEEGSSLALYLCRMIASNETLLQVKVV